jgi:integrase
MKGKSPQTKKLVLALLKRLINFGVKKGLCPVPDPAKLHIELPSVDNMTTEDLDNDQLKALIKAMNDAENQTVANLMRMALYTGMRRGELFKLKWTDVDFENGFILIDAPKGGRSQTIPLSDAARGVLEKQGRTKSPFVFPGERGQQRKCVARQVNKIKEKGGLPKEFRPLHGLRHVYASMLASSGKVDMYTLQKLLTHKSSAMTQRYAHLRDEALKKGAKVADELLNAVNQSE